jgi:hypothetical protein
MKKLLKKIVKKILVNKVVVSLTLFIYTLFFAEEKIKRMIDFFKETFKSEIKTNNSVILVDFFPVEETLISYAFFLNQLKLKFSSKIVPFCYGDSIMRLWAQSIYKSFGSEDIYRVYPTSEQRKRTKKVLHYMHANIKSKDDLMNFKLEDVTIGIDIYESLLRDFNVPTVDLSAAYTWEHIQKGIEIFLHWTDFLNENTVTGIVLSHDNYMWMNILAKVGYKKNVPVYLPSGRFIVKPDGDFSTYKLLAAYKDWFAGLDSSIQAEGLKWAKEQIETRFSGVITEEVYYADKSSYASTSETKFKLGGLSKNKILIASHCFYDNPHAYAKLDYPDFYEWLDYLGNLASGTDYDWYLKVHPDPLPGTLEIVAKIIKKYPGIKLIPHTESHHDLIAQGINWVVSCYGTIGEEYPLLGANVINCGYNPRINFDFNYHMLTREALTDFIKNLGTLPSQEFDKNEIYKFIFCHHRFRYKDDLIFPSYRVFLSSMRANSSAFEYYLSVTNEAQKKKTMSYMNDFISSGKKYMTEIGPVNL